MNEQMLPVFFWLTVVGTVAWLFLDSRLLRLLATRYPQLYDEFGRPGLFLAGKKPVTGGGVAVFLLRRHFQQVDDPELNRLCEGLLALFCLLVFSGGCSLLLLMKGWVGW